jgi:hypothetical protein
MVMFNDPWRAERKWSLMAVKISLQGNITIDQRASCYQKRNCEFVGCQCSERITVQGITYVRKKRCRLIYAVLLVVFNIINAEIVRQEDVIFKLAKFSDSHSFLFHPPAFSTIRHESKRGNSVLSGLSGTCWRKLAFIACIYGSCFEMLILLFTPDVVMVYWRYLDFWKLQARSDMNRKHIHPATLKTD